MRSLKHFCKWLTLCILFISPIAYALPTSLSVEIDPPGTAGLVIDREASFLMQYDVDICNASNNCKIPVRCKQDITCQFLNNVPFEPIYFGGWDGLGKNQTTAIVDLTEPRKLASRINVTWFSYDHNQFYQGTIFLSRQKLMRFLNGHPNENFNKLVVYVARNGVASAWIASDKTELQIDRIQAMPIEYDWNTFKQSLPLAQQHLSRQAYLKQTKAANAKGLPYLDEMFHFKDQDNMPVANMPYKVNREDGRVYCGTSDFEGNTRRINSGTKSYSLSLQTGRCEQYSF